MLNNRVDVERQPLLNDSTPSSLTKLRDWLVEYVSEDVIKCAVTYSIASLVTFVGPINQYFGNVSYLTVIEVLLVSNYLTIGRGCPLLQPCPNCWRDDRSSDLLYRRSFDWLWISDTLPGARLFLLQTGASTN